MCFACLRLRYENIYDASLDLLSNYCIDILSHPLFHGRSKGIGGTLSSSKTSLIGQKHALLFEPYEQTQL